MLSEKHFSGHVGQAGAREFTGSSFIKGVLSVTGRSRDQGPLQDHQGLELESPWSQIVPLNQVLVVLRVAIRFRFLKAVAKTIEHTQWASLVYV